MMLRRQPHVEEVIKLSEHREDAANELSDAANEFSEHREEDADGELSDDDEKCSVVSP